MYAPLRTSLRLLIAMSLITGLIYPLAVTGIAQVLFPDQANGSLLDIGDHFVGSELIGQHFSEPKYFWGRLSATSVTPYNCSASSGSNYGSLHPDLIKNAEQRIVALTADGTPATSIPVDLITASGSGLDPHISPAAARFQIARIAKERQLSEDHIQRLVDDHTQARQFGILGEPRVHVLRLNLALDRLQPQKSR